MTAEYPRLERDVNLSKLPARLLKWAKGGTVLHLESRARDKKPPGVEQEKRGKIKLWAAKSRMRFKVDLGMIPREDMERAFACAVTYPAEFPAPDDHGVYKGHLHRLKQALVREWGASGYWKLEFQKRGAAHYHLIVFGIPAEALPQFRQWLSRTWFEIVASGDSKHLRAGTECDLVRSVGGAMSYMAKYISKDDQTRPGNFTGRYWGKINTHEIPRCEEGSLMCSDKAAVKINRIRRKLINAYTMQSMWKKYCDTRSKLPGKFCYLSRTEIEYAHSRLQGIPRSKRPGALIPLVNHAPVTARGLFPTVYMESKNEVRKWTPPRKRRERSSITGGYALCNVDAFMQSIATALERGLWSSSSQPASRKLQVLPLPL